MLFKARNKKVIDFSHGYKKFIEVINGQTKYHGFNHGQQWKLFLY